jgi:hypothetical protein
MIGLAAAVLILNGVMQVILGYRKMTRTQVRRARSEQYVTRAELREEIDEIKDAMKEQQAEVKHELEKLQSYLSERHHTLSNAMQQVAAKQEVMVNLLAKTSNCSVGMMQEGKAGA